MGPGTAFLGYVFELAKGPQLLGAAYTKRLSQLGGNRTRKWSARAEATLNRRTRGEPLRQPATVPVEFLCYNSATVSWPNICRIFGLMVICGNRTNPSDSLMIENIIVPQNEPGPGVTAH